MTLFTDGRVAIVTGASRGIGRAIALDLAAEGATVVVNYNVGSAEADKVVAAIRDDGGEAVAWQCDVATEASVKAMVAAVRKDVGEPRILVNNAGIVADRPAVLMGGGHWRKVMSVNLDGAFFCSREVLKAMRRSGGAIVNVASVSGVIGTSGQANYSASKGGLIALTKTLAKECGAFGVRVNAVAPGLVETDMTAQLPPGQAELYRYASALGRLGAPGEVAPAVTFLASDRSSFITGQTLVIDGGLAMG